MARRNRTQTVAPASNEGPARAWQPLLVVATVGAFAGLAAWLLAGVLVTRTAGARLPDLPERIAMPAVVADQMAAADAAARANPGSAAAVGQLGIVYHASMRPNEAQQAYALAESLDPSDWRWAYYRGLLFIEHGDHAAATAAFTRVLAIAPGHGLATFHLAEMAFKAGRLSEAEAGYLAARTATAAVPANTTVAGLPVRWSVPLTVHAAFGLARVDLERGNTDGALNRLTTIVADYPSFGPAHTLMRSVRKGAAVVGERGRGYGPPADPLLDAVVAISLHTDLLLKHAALAARAGDVPWREWLARRALDANPRGLEVLLEMAAMHQAAGRHAEALGFLRQCEEVAPDDHHTLVEQGRSLSELGRLEEAERVLRRAVRVRDAAAEHNLATVLDQMDRWDEARLHYDRALTIDPFHARSMNNLAIGLDRRGQSAEAVALYRRALEADPDRAETHSNLASSLIALRRYQEALAELEIAIAMDPAAANAYNNQGIALANSGRFDQARRSFEMALRLEPGHRNAQRNLAGINARR